MIRFPTPFYENRKTISEEAYYERIERHHDQEVDREGERNAPRFDAPVQEVQDELMPEQGYNRNRETGHSTGDKEGGTGAV